MALKLVDKVLSFMGFEEEPVEEETKLSREEEPEEHPWRRKEGQVQGKRKRKGNGFCCKPPGPAPGAGCGGGAQSL